MFTFLLTIFISFVLADKLPDGSSVNFIAIGSYDAEKRQAGMIRSSDGKKWFYSRNLRTEFPADNDPVNPPPFPRPVRVAYGAGGGPLGKDVWVFGGNTEDVVGGVFRPTIYYSVDDGASLVRAIGSVAFGPQFPTSFAYGGSFWLAVGRTNSSQSSTGFIIRSTDASNWTTHSTNLDLSDTFPLRTLAFVNGKFFLATGLGLFSSTDGSTWSKYVNLPLFSTGAGSYPGPGGPTAFAISPFEEYWGAGGITVLGPSPPPVFVYSNDGITWQTQADYIPFSVPNVGDQEVKSMAYGAGQFVILGVTEFNDTVSRNSYLNTVLTASNPSTLAGLGKKYFFDSKSGYRARGGYQVIYSERQSIFVLCGATGDQNGTSMVWSVNPGSNDLTSGTSGNAIGMFDNVCISVATRVDRFSTVTGTTSFASSTLALSTTVLPRGSSLTVEANAQYLVQQGDLKSGGVLQVSQGAKVNSTGSLYFSGTTRIFQGASLQAGVAAVTFPATSALEVVVSSNANNATTIVVPLFNYSFYVGSFSSSRAVNTFDSCSTLTVTSVSYASSTATALISVDSSKCSTSTGSPNALSTGAIVGIAVGAAVGGVCIAIGIFLLVKYLTSRQDLAANKALAMNSFSQH